MAGRRPLSGGFSTTVVTMTRRRFVNFSMGALLGTRRIVFSIGTVFRGGIMSNELWSSYLL